MRMKRLISLVLAAFLLCGLLPHAFAEGIAPVDYTHLRVGNPTPLTGHFFTSMWGSSTSDLDVQELLHRYKLVVYDNELGRYRMNHLVVAGSVTQDDAAGNRTYHIALHDDLTYSDGTPITAWDYAFTFLLMIDPAVEEAGGIPSNESWMMGEEEYLSGKAPYLSGLRVQNDYMLAITVKAEALPYFYELSRFRISPYPIQVIAPTCKVLDEGNGVFLTPGITGDILRRTVLDSYTGYMTAPKVVSGPYTLEEYRNGEAHFRMNPRYKGNQKGETPAIPELTYKGMTGEEITTALASGELNLVNKAMKADTVMACLQLLQQYPDRFQMTSYPRTGLTVLRFMPRSLRVQETAVRKAVFYCLDRDGIVEDYLGTFGMPVKGMYGIGQWMVRLLDTENYPLMLNEETTTQADVEAYEQSLEEWQSISMSAIPDYSLDVEEAVRLLEENGWTMNQNGQPYEDGIRYKRLENGQMIGLEMTVQIPANMREVLEKHWQPYMEQAGMGLRLEDRGIWDLADSYRRDSILDCDMVLVGEDFTDKFRLNGGYRILEQNPDPSTNTPLETLNDEIDRMSAEVYHTEKTDLQGFARKWLDVQIAVAENVPVIPLYSNMYFDFFGAELRGYHVENYLGWGNAIVAAWLGLTDEQLEMQQELAEEGLYVQ